VVLGPTGQNFAAGMSGGIAYVLDNDGDFATRCNPDLVELGRIQDPAEADDVHDLLAEHRDRTGSPQARRLIEDWDATLTRLVRVMPTDYKHALRAQHTDDPTTTGPEPAPSAEPAAGHRKGA
jgi:glutamate synthase domain-containing protein 3